MPLPFNTSQPGSAASGRGLEEWQATVHEGLHVERLHTVRTLQQQTVADHTAHAQAIAVYLAEQHPNVRLSAVLLHLLQHDVAEQYTGDVPASAKMGSDTLKMELKDIEDNWERDNLLVFPMSQTERDVCKLADWLELQRFCIVELEMGNQRIKPVFDNITRYLKNHGAFEHIKGALHLCANNVTRWYELLGETNE